MKRMYFICFLMCAVSTGYAQSETDILLPDFIKDPVEIDFTPDLRYNIPSVMMRTGDFNFDYSLSSFPLNEYNNYNFNIDFSKIQFQPLDFYQNLYNSYSLGDNHWISTYRVNTPYISMGGSYNIGGMYNYKLGDFAIISAGMYAGKNAFNNYYFNSAGFSGNMQFLLGDRFRINVFGKYSLDADKGIPPGVSAMYSPTHYGGTFEFKITDDFGLEVGVDREFDIITRRWVTRPIIAPIFYNYRGR